MAGKREKSNIVIRREEVVEGGHHGGAWKVAYADFVTAMMAFFLLMWLLNATTQEQRNGLADYFSPNSVLGRTASGFGRPFGGRTPNVDGSMVSDRGAVQVIEAPPHPYVDTEDEGRGQPITQRDAGPTPNPGPGSGVASPAAHVGGPAAVPPAPPPPPAAPTPKQVAAQAEGAALAAAAQEIRSAVQSDPALAAVAQHLTVDVTPAGLRVQVLDSEHRAMFATGSAAPNAWSQALVAKVATVLMRLPEPVSIAGYTDAEPYRGGNRTNWELSADRANTVRRMLAAAGLPDLRISRVAGYADQELLLPGDPLAAANRRIAITVLRQAAPAPKH